jgi:hypothetical protein
MKLSPARRPPRARHPPPPDRAQAVSKPWTVTRAIHASWKHAPARPSGPNPKAIVPAVGGLFFPQARSLGIDQTDTSPALQQKIVYAGITSTSFGAASSHLKQLADLTVDPKQVERLTHDIGNQRVAERNAATAAFTALPLVEKFATAPQTTAPDVVAVMSDGGRLQVLDRTTNQAANAGRPVAPAVGTPDPSGGPVVPQADWEEEPSPQKGHWREDKVGLLLTMTSGVSASDPCPTIPASFLDVVRIPKLARQLKKNARAGEDTVVDNDDPEAVAEALAVEAVYKPPQVQTRQVVASRLRWPTFAPLLAAAAWALGFQGAARKAFVGDGSANNWRLQQRFFGSFVPILDFIHALSYVFAAAMAGRPFAVGWACYQQWIGWVWQGQVSAVIAALQERQLELGLPAADEAETSPAQVVNKTLTYLKNQQDKMKYDEYRKAGLPITSSLMESAVKQINQRVKASEKFWSEAGSEAVLQLRADQLSDGEILEKFWERRQAEATGQRRYRRSA